MVKGQPLRVHELKVIHNLNMELLWSNLETLRAIKEYCRKHGLPRPNEDTELGYRVKQLLDIINAINGSPPEMIHPSKSPEDEDGIKI